MDGVWNIQRKRLNISWMKQEFHVKEAIEHPHTQAREMMVHCEHPTAGDLYFQGCVTKMSETPGVVETPSPLLGEHNREIFGLTEEEEAQLKEEGVI